MIKITKLDEEKDVILHNLTKSCLKYNIDREKLKMKAWGKNTRKRLTKRSLFTYRSFKKNVLLEIFLKIQSVYERFNFPGICSNLKVVCTL